MLLVHFNTFNITPLCLRLIYLIDPYSVLSSPQLWSAIMGIILTLFNNNIIIMLCLLMNKDTFASQYLVLILKAQGDGSVTSDSAVQARCLASWTKCLQIAAKLLQRKEFVLHDKFSEKEQEGKGIKKKKVSLCWRVIFTFCAKQLRVIIQ